ncbi:hypothetical protein EK904_014419 [Melospiza melodia maxima]|nr:hypothetical protein EK904_014419 [Melospiza melodia maxima]
MMIFCGPNGTSPTPSNNSSANSTSLSAVTNSLNNTTTHGHGNSLHSTTSLFFILSVSLLKRTQNYMQHSNFFSLELASIPKFSCKGGEGIPLCICWRRRNLMVADGVTPLQVAFGYSPAVSYGMQGPLISSFDQKNEENLRHVSTQVLQLDKDT